MEKLTSLLPQEPGLLPYFMLYVGYLETEFPSLNVQVRTNVGSHQESFAAAVHTIVCYWGTPRAALVQFSAPGAPPPHPLLAHVYGVKNFYTSLIRFYAAYNMSNPLLYDLALMTQVGVLFLYVTEVFVYKNARVREAIFPYVTAGGGTIWMMMQRDSYVSQ
ncbi:ergosterol biosynthesis protein-like protein Erg28 [Xylariaceae sp. FL0662B]|nr:ergosterol biosynthesis protein-like protein Erg28 [Xylariaceae sp. FL0662B]